MDMPKDPEDFDKNDILVEHRTANGRGKVLLRLTIIIDAAIS